MTPWWGSPTPNHYHVKKMALKKLAKSCATRCTVDLNCLKLSNLLITKLVVCFKLMGIVQDKILMPTKYLYFHQTLFWTFKTYCDKHCCCQCHRQGKWLKNLTLPGITYSTKYKIRCVKICLYFGIGSTHLILQKKNMFFLVSRRSWAWHQT